MATKDGSGLLYVTVVRIMCFIYVLKSYDDAVCDGETAVKKYISNKSWNCNQFRRRHTITRNVSNI